MEEHIKSNPALVCKHGEQLGSGLSGCRSSLNWTERVCCLYRVGEQVERRTQHRVDLLREQLPRLFGRAFVPIETACQHRRQVLCAQICQLNTTQNTRLQRERERVCVHMCVCTGVFEYLCTSVLCDAEFTEPTAVVRRAEIHQQTRAITHTMTDLHQTANHNTETLKTANQKTEHRHSKNSQSEHRNSKNSQSEHRKPSNSQSEDRYA